MKILFVYEHFFAPFDEGVKNFAYQVYRQYQTTHDADLVRYYRKLPNALNSLMLVPRLLLRLLGRPDKLVFMPQASLTFSSLLKIWVLHLFYGDRLVVVGTQKRSLRNWQTSILGKLSMPKTFVLSSSMAAPLKDINIKADIVEIGIDRDKYQPPAEKLSLRRKYELPVDKQVVLHVGHIKESRNLNWLLEVQRNRPELQVLVVGSTATEQDMVLCQQLEQAGIRVIRDYLADIQEVYQLADIYCFPVELETAAMETPLSVLEAMATNLPVLTTAFGRLPEQFNEDNCYRYVANPQDILRFISDGFDEPCSNREKTERYTWQASAARLLA